MVFLHQLSVVSILKQRQEQTPNYTFPPLSVLSIALFHPLYHISCRKSKQKPNRCTSPEARRTPSNLNIRPKQILPEPIPMPQLLLHDLPSLLLVIQMQKSLYLHCLKRKLSESFGEKAENCSEHLTKHSNDAKITVLRNIVMWRRENGSGQRNKRKTALQCKERIS